MKPYDVGNLFLQKFSRGAINDVFEGLKGNRSLINFKELNMIAGK